MLPADLYHLIAQALEIIFIISVPLLVAISIVSAVVAGIQGATGINEPALGYAARLVTLVVVLYFLFPIVSRLMIRLADLVYR